MLFNSLLRPLRSGSDQRGDRFFDALDVEESLYLVSECFELFESVDGIVESGLEDMNVHDARPRPLQIVW